MRASTSQYISFSKQGRKDTSAKNDVPIDGKKQEKETPKSLLEELIQEGARRLLQAAIEQEVIEYLERFREEKDHKGHQMVERNGRLPERLNSTPGDRMGLRNPIDHRYAFGDDLVTVFLRG